MSITLSMKFLPMLSKFSRDPEKNMDLWYSSDKWKDVLGADEAETICVPPCLDVLKIWKREDISEALHLAPNISGQKAEAAFMRKFEKLNMGGILVSGLESCDLVASQTVPKEIIQKGEWDAIFFHQNRGIFVIEVKATKENDEDIVNRRIEKANTQLEKNIKNIQRSFLALYQKECTCITGFICFPFRNEDCKTYEGYRIIDKWALNDHAIFRKFFEPPINITMTEIYLLQSFAAEFVCCRSKVEFHSQAYNAMQVATWITEQDFIVPSKRQLRKQKSQTQRLDPKKLNIPGNGPSGKIILTKQQLEIVECREKCVTIRGAPGSGKTLILMLRALKAAMENKSGSVFVFVNEKLKAKYEHYFFEERDKIFVDDDHNIDRRPKIHTIDKINFVKPEDDVFFDETPVEDSYIEKVENRVNCSGSATVVFTGLHKPGDAVESFRLYRPRLQQFKHFELMKVLRGTGNIFREWEHYYPPGITIGHSIDGVAVKSDSFDSFEQVKNEIANKIATLTSTNISNIDLPLLKMEHIAVITCDHDDSTEIRNYFDAKKISCGEVDEQARRLKSTSIVAVDIYRNTPSYEWPIVFIVVKPGVTKKEVLPIAASRCIASLIIFTYRKAIASTIKTDEPHPMEEEMIKKSNHTPSTSSTSSSLSHTVDWQKKLKTIQNSLRRIYSKSYRKLIPFSLPFFFDIESKWVNLTLKVEGVLAITEDYADLLKKAFAKADMLIIEGDPGMGKSSLMHRLAYEWTQEQSQLNDYDLVLYIEFRKIREYEFKDIKELITHYMKGYLDEQDYKLFQKFINDTKCCKQQKILVLLDGYDESALEKQCQELSNFFNSTICRPLLFNILLTSRKGYLSKLRNQGRFLFADINGFTTELQKQDYISKHFNAANQTESSGNTAAVTNLLNTNAKIQRLSESPLMLTFICLTHKKIIDGTEFELYMNIIWWMIDRYQKSNPNQDVPNLFGFEHDASDKICVIENNYQHFPQLHLLGTMAMQDIFKTTFTESDLKTFQLKEIVQQVGFLRKEATRDTSYHTNIEYSFLHRTIQEFIMALTFFFSNEDTTTTFIYYVFLTATDKGYGIIPAKLQIFLNMIYFSRIEIDESKNNLYSELIKLSKELYSASFSVQEHSRISTIHAANDVVDVVGEKQLSIPRSSEEAIQLLHDEAEKGDAFTQYILGTLYDYGINTNRSEEEAIKWYRRSAEQGNAIAQYNLGLMYIDGQGVTQSDEEAVNWLRKSAEQGHAMGQNNLGLMYHNGQGVFQSDEEAVKWYKKSAEQDNPYGQTNLGWMYQIGGGVPQSEEEAVKWYREAAEQGSADAQNNLGFVYLNGICVPQSDEEAVKWYKKAAKQGNADAQTSLGWMYHNGRGVPQSDEEAIKWYTKSAGQGHADAQCNLGNMYENGRGVPQSDEEAVKWYKKSSEQRNANAQNNLGWMCQVGQGVPQSDEEAIKWYRKAAEQGNPIGQTNLGWMYQTGRGVPHSDEEAVKWYRKAAEQGNALAQTSHGWMYQFGRGVPQSVKEAVKWYTKASEQGFVDAQFYLGFMYLNGLGIPQSDEEAVKWYRKAAEQGNALAQTSLGWMYQTGRGITQSNEYAVKWYGKAAAQEESYALDNLGFMHFNGRGVPQSVEEAAKWYRKAAEQGFIDAQFNLGFMYLNGLGVPQSDEEAGKWYRKAAERGHGNAQFNLEFIFDDGRDVPRLNGDVVNWFVKSAEKGYAIAQSNLGWMYYIGLGVLQSDTDAVKWYRKAAEQGNASAQYNLGEMYQNGRGVPQSHEKAKEWYRKAAEQGNADAKAHLCVL